MANIKITVDGVLMDGHKVTFKAPCDCVTVEKLKVCYVEDGTQKTRLFTMKDSHGNDLTGLGNLFSKDAYVDVVLDTNNGFAYLQNAGTNAYLEGKITPVDNLLSDRADLPLSARQGKVLNDSLTADNAQAFQFAYDSASGKYGYKVKEADTEVFVPFKSGMNIGTYGYHVINSMTAGYVCVAITEDFTQSIVTGSNTDTSFKTISGVCSANYGKIKALANGFKYKYRDSSDWVEVSVGTEFSSGNGTIFTWG